MEENPQDDVFTSQSQQQQQQQEGEEDVLGMSSSSRTARATNVPLNIRASRMLHSDEVHPLEDDQDNTETSEDMQRSPLLGSRSSTGSTEEKQAPPTSSGGLVPGGLVRVRKTAKRRKRRNHSRENATSPPSTPMNRRRSWLHTCLLWCCRNNTRTVQSTISCMKLLARLLFWSTIVALVAAVFWYSYELHEHGTEPHLIAWFSAGAFVLLGFPISMWGIVSHLANYNQPRVQVYIVRILWMVPIYSIESWLAMRYHKKAIYIETLRDFYESYVLYSFLQFLIEVLGGEESLILMLKDKSPTRGFHMWGLQWCIKPWLMGQPVSKTVYERAATNQRSRRTAKQTRAIKRIHWKSPFFVKCKFGVLQYVLLKLLSAIAVLWLEWKGWYKEGEFDWDSGYLYICIVTNVSQCWALYCMIFFYYATHNELSPIRPVGKFLSVKALVFFTWWQSVIIAILYNWGMIPEALVNVEHDWTKEDVAKGIQDYLICVEMFIASVVHTFVFPHTEYTPQAVEARNRALNHHPGKSSAWNHQKKRLGRSKYAANTSYAPYWNTKDDASKSSALQGSGFEMVSLDSGSLHTADTWEDPLLWQPIQPQQEGYGGRSSRSNSVDFATELSLENTKSNDDLLGIRGDEENPYLATVPDDDGEDDETGDEGTGDEDEDYDESVDETSFGEEDDDDSPIPASKPGFVRALLDSAIPRDLGDNTIGIVKGAYNVEKKTLLHHATTSDQYDLFSPNRRRLRRKSET